MAVAQDIGLVVSVGWRVCRKRFLVITDAVFVEKFLIDKRLINEHPCDPRYQCSVCAWADRDPLVFTTGCGVGITRIDDNHSGI